MPITKQEGFTPGPWKVDSEMVIDSRGIQICVVETVNYDEIGEVITDNECDANARLIAAAPEMVAALRELSGRIEGLLGTDLEFAELWRKVGYEFRAAREILARVEGGQ